MKLPTPWQLKIIYAALTALSLLAICWVGDLFFTAFATFVKALRAFLIPLAIAGVFAYLLEPVVQKLCSWKLSRTAAVLIVFGVFIVGSTLILFQVIPELSNQIGTFWQNIPAYTQKARESLKFDNPYLQKASTLFQDRIQQELPNYTAQLATLTSAQNILQLVRESFGGVLGAFGYVAGMLIIPLYLFYFLKEASEIQNRWSDYLPLQASHFKDEVVDALTEINGYLIAFFRGQLLVSMIDGVLIGFGLLFLGLPFGLLIGLMVAVLGLIPYLGIFICWIPAVIIAFGQPGGGWGQAMWVTLIFVGMNQLEGWFIAPKIVGNSVGLHPLTVIASVIGWGLLLGGLLGAILAVPLTATLKVLLRRYVWHRKPKPGSPGSPAH